MPKGPQKAIRNALCHSGEPWTPELAGLLTMFAWRRLAYYGFCISNYGTHRWLTRNPKANRLELARLRAGTAVDCRIEALPEPTSQRYESSGLVFAPPVPSDPLISTVRSAVSLIGSVPTLYTTVAAYLHTLHVLRAPAADYDVSHSDPEVPFSIFVSVPSGKERRIRLAESIIHECMHLHLTMIESAQSLVGERETPTFSPWRQTMRPIGGVLHGLYVCTVIDAFLQALRQSLSLTRHEKAFVLKRRNEIAQEVKQVSHFATTEGLTVEGRLLALRCLSAFGL